MAVIEEIGDGSDSEGEPPAACGAAPVATMPPLEDEDDYALGGARGQQAVPPPPAAAAAAALGAVAAEGVFVKVALGADGSILGAAVGAAGAEVPPQPQQQQQPGAQQWRGAQQQRPSAAPSPPARAAGGGRSIYREHSAWATIADPAERAEVERQRGNDAFRRGLHAEAARHYTAAADALEECAAAGGGDVSDDASPLSAASLRKRRAVLRANRAQALLRLGRFGDALDDCVEAAGLDASSVKARYRAGAAAYGMGDHELALEWAARALELAPGDAAVLALRRRAQAAQAETKGATDLVERAKAARENHGAPAVRRGRLHSPEPLLLVEALVAVLLDDDLEDEEDDIAAGVDPAQALEQLYEVLATSKDAGRYFAACRGYQAALSYIESETKRVEAVIKAAGGLAEAAEGEGGTTSKAGAEREVTWPSSLPGVLARRCFASGISNAANTSLAGLLEWGCRDPAQRCGAYAERAEPGEEGTGGPCVLACRTMLSTEALSRTSVAAAAAAAAMLRRFGGDSASRGALHACGCEPLRALLHLYSHCERLSDASLHEGDDVPKSMEDIDSQEGVVKYMMRESERIYNPRLTAVRRECMAALAALMRDPALLRADAFDRRSDMMGQRRTVVSELLPGLLAAVAAIESRSPRKSTQVLGLDQRPKAYEQRRYAADYNDNRTGDYLASITVSGDPNFTHSQGITVVEHALDALLAAAATPAGARALDVCEVADRLQPFHEWSTPGVVACVERIYSRLASASERLVGDLLGADATAVPLGGLVLCGAPRLQYRGMRRLATIIDTMPGNDFAHLTRRDGAMMRVWTVLCEGRTAQGGWRNDAGTDGVPKEGEDPSDAQLEAAARQVYALAVGRARGPGGGRRPPRGGCWDQMGYEALLDMEAAVTGRAWRKSGMVKPADTVAAETTVGCGEASARRRPAAALAAEARFAPPAPTASKPGQLARGFLKPSPVDERGGGKATTPADAVPAPKAAAVAAAPTRPARRDDGVLKAGFLGGPKRRSRGERGERRRPKAAGRSAGEKDAAAAAPEAPPPPEPATPTQSAPPEDVLPEVHVPASQLDQSPAVPATGNGEGKAPAGRRPWYLDMREDDPEDEPVAHAPAPARSGKAGGKGRGSAMDSIDASDDDGGGYDEDGMRDVKGFDSKVPDSVRAARNTWLNTPLHEKLRWTQGATDVHGYIQVPRFTKPRDLHVEITPTRLAVSLHWYGRVFDGPLRRRVKSSEAVWTLEDDEVHVALPKDDAYFWKSFYEGGEEKGHLEIWREINEDEDSQKTWDELTPDEKKQAMERAEYDQMVAEGLVHPDDIDAPTMILGDDMGQYDEEY